MSESKLRWRNFPMFLLKGLIEVAAAGERKHGIYDYLERDYTTNDHLDALKRHLAKFEDPDWDDLDEDSKKLHIYHVAWRALLTGYTIEKYPERDDRWQGPKK